MPIHIKGAGGGVASRPYKHMLIKAGSTSVSTNTITFNNVSIAAGVMSTGTPLSNYNDKLISFAFYMVTGQSGTNVCDGFCVRLEPLKVIASTDSSGNVTYADSPYSIQLNGVSALNQHEYGLYGNNTCAVSIDFTNNKITVGPISPLPNSPMKFTGSWAGGAALVCE